MSDHPDFQGALRGNRFLCAAILGGPLCFAFVLSALSFQGELEPMLEDDSARSFAFLGALVAMLVLPLAFVIRAGIWKRGRALDATGLLQAFFTGNIVFHGVLAGESSSTCCSGWRRHAPCPSRSRRGS